ncbi:hypothetical protein NQT69_11480 [Pseudoalteromonas shioyasakiensis]|uniref:hypothetical protein n=1 Tax=Pseudoalteromonas shioyasakiensis TaxID=1190813 RepID=UPI002119072B|nr:hypothetical protein [Pseudoalteromonas shioyasakiensis]MCQ8878625.1 hypothetical protein [Pseudoalteromonas shioyasakiensis]
MKYTLLSLAIALSAPTIAAETKEVQDMSDPLAIYTQVGAGVTDKGINLKVGQAYDTGDKTTAAMNIIEVKGILGDTLGWRSDSQTTNSIDSFRFRNFTTKLTNGTATQIDANYSLRGNLVAEETMDVSYSFIKALPPKGKFSFYPLAGVGVSVGESAIEDDGSIDSGYSTMGVYGLIGMYSKVAITDQIWINYNPFWLSTIAGSDNYKDNYYGFDQSHILTHEFAVSYQINPRMNLRYFANWNENVDFFDGDQRIEFNYQL